MKRLAPAIPLLAVVPATARAEERRPVPSDSTPTTRVERVQSGDVIWDLARQVRLSAGVSYRLLSGTSCDDRLRGVAGSVAPAARRRPVIG